MSHHPILNIYSPRAYNIASELLIYANYHAYLMPQVDDILGTTIKLSNAYRIILRFEQLKRTMNHIARDLARSV